ncbi:CpaD family pilus assembly protein [Luteithermobacter gelatinilyticus]|uniref:CpaD family pilus assembly protein n=1 Tax=Luteithermobacter gelatinilyticus TaxID=2582913 RepID=UPI001105E550|nr:CpaD family pilus assembly lipoprotein [Luteithermobacter gelatinilyticus]|tara:strand:- start:652 stop:1272 length:621 start_codon:yes stop_codon:yes gene_type:complete
MWSKIKYGLILSLLLVTAGCSSMQSSSSIDMNKRNEVQLVRIPHEIRFAPNSAKLSAEETRQLMSFLDKMKVGYGDELSMDFPLEDKGSLSALDQKRFAYVAEFLKRHGLHLASEITPYGVEPEEGAARLLLSRYVVTPPQCGDWSEPSSPNYNNTPLRNFGCSTQANLGLMVANPRDLITGNAQTKPNTETAAKAVNAYNSGGKK